MIKLIVYGEPVAQGRPRFSTRGGFVKTFDPEKSRSYKDTVYGEALKVKPETPLDSPLAVKIDIYRAIPKSFSKKRALLAQEKVLRPTTKPDASNVCKGIEDALNGVIWRDDSLIVSLAVQKFYSNTPRVEIEVEELNVG